MAPALLQANSHVESRPFSGARQRTPGRRIRIPIVVLEGRKAIPLVLEVVCASGPRGGQPPTAPLRSSTFGMATTS